MVYLLIFILILSLVGNAILIWYLRELLKRLWLLTNSKKDIWDVINNYSNHLKAIYEMEMFYGDETIQNLIEHTKYLKTYLDDYKEAQTLFEEEELAEEEKEKE
tara:strand:+ start:694 stop:1005 length:312 start_codon:yes stop_codon:yes gene_type:complete